MALEILTPVPVYIDYVSAHMRKADVDEVYCGIGCKPLAALWRSVASSAESYAALLDGVPVAIFGVGLLPLPTRTVGSPWLLGTDAVLEHPKSMMRESRKWLARWFDEYGALANFVHAENAAAIRWLEILDFSVAPETVSFAHGEFRCFSRGLD